MTWSGDDTLSIDPKFIVTVIITNNNANKEMLQHAKIQFHQIHQATTTGHKHGAAMMENDVDIGGGQKFLGKEKERQKIT